jgi:hypothetical protein
MKGGMKLKPASCDVRDLSGDEVRSLPLVGRVGRAADDAQHRLEAEAGVVETSEARSQVHTRGLVVAHPHPTGLRPATLPTRGRDKKEMRRPLASYAIAPRAGINVVTEYASNLKSEYQGELDQ